VAGDADYADGHRICTRVSLTAVALASSRAPAEVSDPGYNPFTAAEWDEAVDLGETSVLEKPSE
jgi:hypothetical protein